MKFIRVTNAISKQKEFINVTAIQHIRPGRESNSVQDHTTISLGSFFITVLESDEVIINLINRAEER